MSETATPTRFELGTSFVGREPELAEGARLLRETRLLTITGTGGVGKTRYATELVRRIEPTAGQAVATCLFASLRDPQLVLPTIARALGVPDRGDNGALELIAERLGESQALLFLDNLEHLLAASPQLSRLVDACPRLTVLCTSRQRLRVDAELAYELPPLGTDESVMLFCERARVAPSKSVRELCARLEGLPLALELAAARTRVLSPEQLVARLAKRLDLLKNSRDADPRQQTLRATIEWSHDLLSDREQRLFRALSVFEGGCTLEAAEDVSEAELDDLESLVDKSLLRRLDTDAGSRFWMLETIRAYAAERLDDAPTAELVRRKHAEHFTSFARRASSELHRSEATDTIARLDEDVENFRAALAFRLAAGDREQALALATDLWFYWHWRGMNREGGAWLEAALADPDVGGPSLRARALNRAAVFADERGDLDTARELNEESLALARAAGDRETEVSASHDLAGSYGTAGDIEEAARRYEEAILLFRELDDEAGLVIAMVNFGTAYRRLGRFDDARARHREAVERGRALGNGHFLAIALSELGLTELEASSPADAGPVLREALQLAYESGAAGQVPWIISWLAVAASRAGAPETAAHLDGAAERLLSESGKQLDDVDAALVQDGLAEARAHLGAAAFERARAAGAAMSLDEIVAFALRGETDD